MSVGKAYIITGAPGTGKSTVINALKKSGHACYDEVARGVIAQELWNGKNRLPWVDIHGFSELVLAVMLSQKKEVLKNQLSFLDRGIPDIIGYFNHANVVPPKKYLDALSNYAYQKKVFFTPVWEEIYVTDTERMETIDEAKRVSESLYDTYNSLGFELIELPKISTKERLDFILQKI